ncbi:MAG: hypothetical protein A2505_11035 [Deltaproteobacteria bacterium RIFOXYD12_FULL_55_16]|nr:MAG: hypothetical protein A2505_11035 [Deltaproteobacteria bacterium RIFOXYD12_FULL_55_16]
MGKRNRLIGRCCLLWLFVALYSPALAVEVAAVEVDETPTDKAGKKYPHPHTVHMNVMELNVPEFTRDDISDWPKLVQDLKAAPPALPLSVEVRMMLAGLRPTELSNSDRQVLVKELNKILVTWTAAEASKGMKPEEVKWVMRERLVSLFPSLMSKKTGAQLGKITCGTCHESQVRLAREYMERQNLASFDEKTVLDCFTRAITGEKGFGECEAMAEMLKKTRIEPYGPLRNFIQRPLKETEISLFVAIRPEDPYIFKPLLKKLVCLECHGVERKVKVNKIRGLDGKEKDMPVFYGLGAGSHKKQ